MSVDLYPTVVEVGSATAPPPAGAPTPGRRGSDPRPHGPVAVPELADGDGIAVHSVNLIGADNRCSVSVELRRDDDQAIAVQEGVWATAIARRLSAGATLQALGALRPAAGRFGVEAVVVAPVGTHQVATVVLVEVVAHEEQAFTGSALVGAAGEHDAIARAVLDGSNRRLSAS